MIVCQYVYFKDYVWVVGKDKSQHHLGFGKQDLLIA